MNRTCEVGESTKYYILGHGYLQQQNRITDINRIDGKINASNSSVIYQNRLFRRFKNNIVFDRSRYPGSPAALAKCHLFDFRNLLLTH